jgi:hypothetical protein
MVWFIGRLVTAIEPDRGHCLACAQDMLGHQTLSTVHGRSVTQPVNTSIATSNDSHSGSIFTHHGARLLTKLQPEPLKSRLVNELFSAALPTTLEGH